MPNLRDCHIRQRTTGVWEIRYRKGGANMSFSSKSLNIAKNKAREYFRGLKKEIEAANVAMLSKQIKPTFAAFAESWLTIEKKPYIKEITYNDYRDDIAKHIVPQFGSKPLNRITYLELQSFLNEYVEAGQYRTAKKLRNLLQQIFQSAVDQEILDRSPAVRLKEIVYEQKSGEAFTLEEEREFVRRLLESSYTCRHALLLILYTGIRRDELKRVVFNEDRTWITVQNGKTKKGKTAERRIPVSPMLAPYVWKISDEELQTKNDYLSRTIPALTDGRHHLHELRHTFISRCRECGIESEVVSRWVGHSRENNTTDKVYIHFSDQFQLSEVKKLRY